MTIFLGLILALLPSYLIRLQILGIPTTFLELLIVVFLFATITKFRISDLERIKSLGKINYAVGLFVLAAIVSTVISPESLKALGQLKAFIIEPVLIFYSSVLLIKKKEDLKWPLILLLLSSSVISLFGLIQYFTHLLLPLQFWGSGLEPKRITSFFEYPNALALYLTPLFSFFFVLWYKRYEFVNRKLLTTGLVLMLMALILTLSRGAWVAALFASLMPVLVTKISKTKLLIGLILLIGLLLLPGVGQRLTIADQSSVVHRDLLAAGVGQLLVSPVLGNGLYGFRDALMRQGFQEEILNYPHNIFLNFWLELGLLGLLSFALILRFSLAQYKKSRSVVQLAAGIYLLALLIHGLVDVPYFKNDLAVLFWFILSLFYISE